MKNIQNNSKPFVSVFVVICLKGRHKSFDRQNEWADFYYILGEFIEYSDITSASGWYYIAPAIPAIKVIDKIFSMKSNTCNTMD